jgi:hypothetical protein
MGSDGAGDVGYREASKFRRRRKKFQGADWTPPSMSAFPEDGEWCRPCKMRHGYSNIGVKFEKRSDGGFRILWLCPKYGHVVGTKDLGEVKDADA